MGGRYAPFFFAMLEAGVTAAVALVAGAATLTNRLHGRVNSVHDRISKLDSRIDEIEIGLARNYVQRSELKDSLRSFEDYMIRIEGKLDTFIANYPKR